LAAVESLICGRLPLVDAPGPVFLYSENRAFCQTLPDMSIHGCEVAMVALSDDSRNSTCAVGPQGRPSWVVLLVAPVIVHL
jgi:hypothetical protein